MSTRWLLLTAIPLLLAAAGPEDSPAAKERKKLQGAWVWTSAILDGQSSFEDDIKAGKVVEVFDGDEIIVKQDGQETGRVTYSIDPTKNPKWLDITFTRDGKRQTCLGCYQLDGDTLKYCLAGIDADRPTEIASKSGSQYGLWVMKKKK